MSRATLDCTLVTRPWGGAWMPQHRGSQTRIPDQEALVVHHENIRLTFAQLKEEVGPDFEPSKWAGAGPQVPSLVELQGWCLGMGQGAGAA